MKKRLNIIPPALLAALFLFVAGITSAGGGQTFLPIVARALPTPTPTATATPTPTPTPTITPTPGQMVEFRGLWVSRFDWTNYNDPADPAKIDEIVNNAAAAGFNAIFFQIRGTADAFYDSPIEPWAHRVSGAGLGVSPDPYWDPLAYMVDKAHAQGMQVHAYINVYPVWNGSQCDDPPDPAVQPQHLYWKLVNEYGTTEDQPNGLQWYSSGNLYCGSYQRVTPASGFFDDHLLAVVTDLVQRYDINGIHLDHIRYGHRTTSCDPVSLAAAGTTCFGTPANYNNYEDFQRAQVNGTVWKVYNHLFGGNGIADQSNFWLSAAVWPVYIDYWGWGASEGYNDFYQDSKEWISNDYIDAISPMIYGGTVWDTGSLGQSRWYTLVDNFLDSANGRFILPGINGGYEDFSDIETRIEMSRQLNTGGHAIFSYGGLYNRGYFDDLANGPYAQPAVPPDITWHP